MDTPNLYRLEVVPLVILPLGRSPFFSYASHEPVPSGSLISVSFGKQQINGIVFDCQKLPGIKPVWMKNISSVVRQDVLTEEQCSLAEEISKEYFTPLGRVLNHFLPKEVKARKKVTESEEKIQALRSSKDETLLIRKVNSVPQTKPLFIDTSALPDAKRLYILLAKKLSTKGQVLIIVPEITLIFALEKMLRENFDASIISVLHSLLSPGPFFENWERIRTGKTKIILATRQGLFAPYKNLSLVIFTEEQEESYKQWDMSPRYHAKRVVSMLAEIQGAKLLFTSGTPSVEMYHAINTKRILAIRPIVSHPPIGHGIGLINLRFERYKKNVSPFSEELINRVRTTLRDKGQILLYINRQGMNTFSVCESCKNVFRCEKCAHPLTGTKEGNFRCLSCGYKSALFPNCPTCGGLTFKHIGFGTEKIEKEAMKLFPYAHIARLDSSMLRTGKTTELLFQKGMAGKIDILIGTQMILKDPPLPNLSLIAMMDADSLLFFPDFKADERVFQHLLRGAEQIRKRGPGKMESGVLIQTFHPESIFLNQSKDIGSKDFYKKILRDREALFYPPFSRLVSVTIKDPLQERADEKALQISAVLSNLVPKTFKIHPPQAAYFLKKKNIFESSILIRMPEDEVMPPKFVSALQNLSKDCIIDVDPLSFR